MQKWYLLQLFADGGEGGGEGSASATGEGSAETTVVNNAADEHTKRLLELGVPKDKIRNRAKNNKAVANNAQTQEQQQQGNAQAAAETKTEEAKPTTDKVRMTWDEIMADPEYNKQMQSVVQERVKKSKAAVDAMEKLTPALNLLAQKHGLDVNNMDYDALNKAISDDDSFYEDKALELGIDMETAKKLEQKKIEDSIQAKTIEEQKFEQHIQKLEQQAEAMKAVYPNFDLKTELRNPAFARMTSPNVGISVEDAYFTIHRKEIQQATVQIAEQKKAQQISQTIQAGQRRPVEAGTSGQAPSVTQFDYSKASREQREALKKQIRDAAAHGQKIYPGQR